MKYSSIFLLLLFITSCNETSYEPGKCYQAPDSAEIFKVTDAKSLKSTQTGEIVESKSGLIVTSCP